MNISDYVNPDYADRVHIGKNLKIQPGSVLGALPLIFDRETGQRVRPEMRAGLVIGDDVDIGACCVLNIGEEHDTTIGDRVMIGHLSSIGHDAVISSDTGISAHVCICGCAEVGRWCYVAPQVVVKPYVKIGDRTMIGMGSVVNRDLPDGVIAFGSPCRVVRDNTWRPPT